MAVAGRDLVIVETNEAIVDGLSTPVILGDATEDEVFRAAGIERRRAGGRRRRRRSQESVEKLRRAGADRVVNPQSIDGARMAAFVLRPHVAEFLDVVMHERSLEFRLEEVVVSDASPIVGRSLREAQLRDYTGALVLALRDEDGTFHTNPPADTEIRSGQVIIAIGTQDELDRLVEFVREERVSRRDARP